MIETIFRVKKLILGQDKKYLFFILILSLIAALLETVGVASFLPIIEFFSGENITGIYSYFNKIKTSLSSDIDEMTEQKIINELLRLENMLTIILITHKMTNLKNANKIIKIENKEIKILNDEK